MYYFSKATERGPTKDVFSVNFYKQRLRFLLLFPNFHWFCQVSFVLCLMMDPYEGGGREKDSDME
ncbi:hypothetical protein KSS87_011150, partial [Heliosperma pusillum]